MKLKRPQILILICSLALFGCSSHRHRPHGGKLSEAMEKASDTYPGERNIDTPHGEAHPHDFSIRAPMDTQSLEPRTSGQIDVPGPDKSVAKSQQGLIFSLAGGAGLFKSDDFHPLTHFDLSLGVYVTERHRWELYAGFGWAQVDKSDTLENAIDGGISKLSLGLRYKYFTTPRYTFLGHYLIVGAGYTDMLWRYRNDIQVDGRTIGSDSIGGVEVFAGMGFHLMQTRHFQFGVEVLPSAILWFPYTREGFDNDIFGNPMMLKLRCTVSFLP